MKIGYARVSTADQSLDLQLDALKEFGCEDIYQEKVSGAKDDRQQLELAIRAARKGDTFVVYKLDRLARSTKKLIEITEKLKEKDVEFVSIQDKVDTNTAVGRAMFGMLSVLAEFERDIIRERTMAGLKSARARGRKGGRPKKDQKKLDAAVALYQTRQYSLKQIQEHTSVSPTSLYREIDKRNLERH